jgi:Ca2+-binding RTX toxin-like protein
MIHRNTDATHLPGDVFSRPDFFLEADISKQFNAGIGIGFDPTTDQVEIDPFLNAASGGGTNGVVLRTDIDQDGIAERLEYTGAEHVVLGGTDGNDWLIGGKGDDTLWGDDGDDRLEGGDGNDLIFGGKGNDIITDLFGVDEIRSGEGDDVVSAGRGIKLIITDTGNDWVWGGVDDDEVLAGQGDDFVNGGDGSDFLIGGEGNDWLESGRENGLMLGDNGDLIQGLPIKRSVDSRIVGHDVLLATGGNADFDAETGDDIMVGGLGTDRFFGQFGFDWASYKFDPFGIEADMNNRLFAPPSLPASPGAILDRYAQTEGLSGSALGDILRGDDIADLTGAAGDAGAIVDGLDHALYDFNVDLIFGLDELLGSIDEDGDVRFSAGNILLGGGSSDIIEGRGGNDVIDGDAWLNVRIGRFNEDGVQIETFDTMAGYQQRVLAGEIKVAELKIVREILYSEFAVDIAEYSGVRADYAVEGINDLTDGSALTDSGVTGFARDINNDGFITVAHLSRDVDGTIILGENGVDGVDNLKNVERLLFSDQTIKIIDHANTIATGAPTITSSTGTLDVGSTLTASASGIVDPNNVGQIVFYWQVELVPGSGVFSNIQSVVADELAPVTGPSFTLTAAEAGLAVRVLARFKDGDGVFETVVSAAEGGTGVPIGDGIPLIGTGGDDLLIGTPAADAILGLGGNDILVGLGGDDVLDGGADTDTAVFFGQLADFVFERTPEGDIEVINQITGEEDIIANIELVRIVDGGVVNGQIVGTTLATFTIAEVIAFADGLALPPNNVATNGDDILVDVADNQLVINGLGGNDEIFGLNQADQLSGGAGDDLLFGGAGNDTLNGGPGSDLIDGGGGNDGAVFDGPLANFTLSISQAGNILVTENATGDEDEVLNVENFVFTGQTLTLAQTQTLAGLLRGTGGPNIFNGTAADEAFAGLGGADVLNGGGGDDVLLGGNGADTLNGGAGRDGLTGGPGNDIVNGNGGDDTIFWSSGDGLDTIDGGAGSDTLEINGEADVAETFRIFTAAEAIAAGLTAGTSEIVVTRTVGNAAVTNADRVALVNNVEEIVINGDRLRDNSAAIAGDTIQIIGDFTTTSLALNTITVNGGRGDDTYDVTGLTSAHRLVVNDKGGNNSFSGGRPQDQFKLLPGTTINEYVANSNGNGTTTYTMGGFSITIDDDTHPTMINGTGFSTPGSGGAFFFTSRDITELKNLVAGRPSAYADDGASGIRDLEGTGNNIASPNAGAADQPFIRLTDARYGEGGSVNPIHAGLDPRAISNILGDQEANLAKNAAGANIFFMAFGQYVDHGLDFLPKDDSRPKLPIGTDPQDDPADLTRGKISGYDENGDPEYQNQASPFVDQNQAYGSTEVVGQLLRESAPGGKVGAHLLQGATDQSNTDFALLPTLREALQHHWEADTKFTDAAKGINGVTLKAYYPGLIDAGGNFNPAIVAQLNADFLGSGYQLIGDANFAINILDHYVAGDLRANENYTLTSIHTVWARNHNYHVERLQASGFDGTQEELFQAAKIVNEAEYQRVVFTEFTDYLLGGLKGGGQHGHDEYNPDATAQISHEFAAAAYRFGHSQIGQTITILDENGNPKSVDLFDAFLNPTNDQEAFLLTPAELAQYGYSPKPGFEQIGVSDIIGGIVRQQAEEVDFNVVDAVRNDLVRIRADLFAFNVARGWDVGLGTLNQVRAGLLNSTDKYVSEAVELSDEDLSPYASWEDFQNRNGLSDEVIDQFRAAYPDLVLETTEEIAEFGTANPDIVLVGGNTVKGIDRVDLWVGGLAEKHINDGVVGTTFWVILHEQFDRLQEADRFYYLDRVGDADFYEALKELKFSDIVERNTGLTDLPKDIFSATDKADDDDGAATGEGSDDEADNGESEGDESEDDETEDDEDEDEDEIEDEDDDTTTTGPSPGTGTATSSFVVYLGAAVASETIIGGTGLDLLSGGDGDDHLFGYDGDDVLIGGDGDDYLDGGDGDDILNGGRGTDVIKGGAGDDEVDGGAGRDIIMTGAGDDVIFVRNNDAGDVIDAGDEAGDSDTLDMSAISANITVYLSANGSGTAIADGTTHTIKGIENVVTGDGDDVIVASSDVNVLEGGAGRDTFVFSTVNSAGGEDVIKDLNFLEGDTIDLTPLFSSLALGDVSFTNADFSASGRVRLTADELSNSTLIEVSTDNDHQDVELAIRILGRTDLDQKDFGIA